MDFKLTVVVDNCVPIGAAKPFLGEHGLSMLLEADGRRLLLDTGQSSAVVHNLGLLGVPPATLDAIVISHGHYDHAGGLAPVLSQAGRRLPVHLHAHAFKERYSVSGGVRRFAGIPLRAEQLASLGADWRMPTAPVELLPGVWLSAAVPRGSGFETGDTRLVAPAGDCDCQDEIEDDMALFCNTADGLVVVSGCTHSGLVNMVRHGLAVSGAQRLRGWIGGTHLGPVSAGQQERTIAELQAWAPDFVAANHCTGFAMMARLQQAFGDRFVPAFVGTVLAF